MWRVLIKKYVNMKILLKSKNTHGSMRSNKQMMFLNANKEQSLKILQKSHFRTYVKVNHHVLIEMIKIDHMV